MQFVVEGPLADQHVLSAAFGPEGFKLEPTNPVDSTWPKGLLTPQNLDAFKYYLDCHNLKPTLEGVASLIQISPVNIGGKHFDAENWTTRWRDIWAEASSEILGYFGNRPAEEVAGTMNMVWTRADTRLRARSTPRRSLSGFDRKDMTVHEFERSYARYFTVEDYTYSHARFDGTEGAVVTRAVFVAADAVTVLPYDPVRDRVLLIEQARCAPMARGDTGTWVMEPVAGRIEPGDDAESTAHKETLEEAGLTLTDLHKITEYYPSTGAFSEYLYAYVGIADLPDGAATLGGVASEGEDIKGHVMSRTEMMAMIARGDISVGPLILSAYWLDANYKQFCVSG